MGNYVKVNTDGDVWCPTCAAYSASPNFRLEKSKSSGYSQYCRTHEWEHEYFRLLMKKHGLSRDAYMSLVEEQGNVCAICKEEGTQKYCVDHDHTTGAVRGLLCRPCNLVLGNAKDSTTTLESAVAYLRKAQST